MMLTAAQLAEIQARCEAATPGPWEALDQMIWETRRDGQAVACSLMRMGPFPMGVADAKFIAHTRQDIPDLLAHIDALRAERDALLLELAAW